MPNTTKPILERYHVDYNEVVNSKKWFNDQVAFLKKRNITQAGIMRSAGQLTFKPVPGNLYFYHYDPKLKDTLPYYDTFPLVFPYKAVPGGFLGLNMHYLGYKERFALFKKLHEVNSNKITEQTKMKFSWSMISSMASMKPAEHCIKHYLLDHIASPFCKVHPEDWATAMMMPVSSFVGEKQENIWNRNRR